MLTAWPGSITSSPDIELRIGLLRSLFVTKNFESTIAFILGLLPLGVSVLAFVYWVNQPGPSEAWIMCAVAFFVSLALFALVWWYRSKRKFFCLCENGCAFGSSLGSVPQIFAWSEVQEIKLEEDAYLKVEENNVWGFKISESLQEVTRQWLSIKSSNETIRFKLKEFAEYQSIVEQVMEHSKDKEINLEHARVESPELQMAKADAGSQLGKGKTVYYAVGVAVFIIILVLKVIVQMKR